MTTRHEHDGVRLPPAPSLAGARRSTTPKIKDVAPRATLFAEIPRAASASRPRAAGCTSTIPRTGSPTKPWQLLLQLAEERGLARSASTPCSAATRSTSPRSRAVLHVALRAPRGASIEVDGENVVPEVHAVLDRMAEFAASRAHRRLEGPHRQAHPQCRQHRHRRLRISARRWPTRRCGHYSEREHDASASSPMSTAPTSPRRRTISTRPRRCSSSPPRPSPRSRR